MFDMIVVSHYLECGFGFILLTSSSPHAQGDDVIVPVPLGTMIKDEESDKVGVVLFVLICISLVGCADAAMSLHTPVWSYNVSCSFFFLQ